MAKLGTSVVPIDSVAISGSMDYVMEQGRDGAAGKHRPCAGHGRGVLLFVQLSRQWIDAIPCEGRSGVGRLRPARTRILIEAWLAVRQPSSASGIAHRDSEEAQPRIISGGYDKSNPATASIHTEIDPTERSILEVISSAKKS
jgi:hypothetical protein